MAWGLRKAYVIRLSLYRLYFEFISKTFKLYMSGKTSSTCWRAKCGETASLKIFYNLIHTVQKLFFALNISLKKLPKWLLL